jgi:hypothetical protein
MTTVTGLTAERMLAIEAESIVDGDISGNDLILTRKDGVQINAGNVRGPAGPTGPIGSDLSVLAAATVLDVGQLNQIRAGRQLAAVDFTNLGLSVPIGLWNLSDLTDASGNGRALSNKGAVPFASGINGLGATAARFAGNVAQAFYIADTGAADPFRIKLGSMGCWFKTSKRGATQTLMGKWNASGATYSYILYVATGTNTLVFDFGLSGPGVAGPVGSTDVADDRWHFAVATFDGTVARIYADGVLENQVLTNGTLFPTNVPFNIGAAAADAATAAQLPFFGRIDEAFITADVLTEDQIRNLYCAKITHALGVRPTRASVSVIRRRRGAALVAGDFPVQPLRLHNFSAGSLGDAGSQNIGLTNNGVAVSVAGADGTKDNAFSFAGAQSLSGSDAGLPAALTARSFGCWLKSSLVAGFPVAMGWGTAGSAETEILLSNGVISIVNGADQVNGPFAADGQWHHIVVVEDNAAVDGVKRKLYMDGRVVATSLVMNPITLAGANRFRIGARPDDAGTRWTGQIDAAFVTDQALTAEQIMALYDKSAQALPQSPKNSGDHVEALRSTDILAAFDTLQSNSQIDLGVAA